MTDTKRSLRTLAPALTLLTTVSLGLAGCATPSVGDAAPSPTTTPTPSVTTPAPSPSDGPTPTSSPDPVETEGPERSTAELLDACLTAVGDDNAPASEQLARSAIATDQARSALRPDGLWYVVVPLDDPTVDGEVEYACLLTTDLAVDASWGRLAPEIDDFEQWATATEPAEGL
ncbi:hypothetical protein [Microbacterium sp. cf332]|uniref:hypothetical protein n=1 Tax=Microbacterium sp. cf332 TaxID=1761804 RepID=UPI00088153D2|nr:hypothetical protein [Microbacterium sp. cf332]SDQ81934.1 hypothetical protein SAMN04487847_2617 [Microbacterium sp. cf332]